MLPHRGSSLLIDRVLEHDGDSTAVLATVGSPSWLSNNAGDVPPWLAAEFMAQCVGAHEGIVRPTPGKPPEGYLVSVTKLRLQCEGFRPNERLRVCARLLRRSPGIGIASYVCEIDSERDGGEPVRVADGTINVLIPPQVGRAATR